MKKKQKEVIFMKHRVVSDLGLRAVFRLSYGGFLAIGAS